MLTPSDTHTKRVSLLSAARNKQSALKENNHGCGQVNNTGSSINVHSCMYWQYRHEYISQKYTVVGEETYLTICQYDFFISSSLLLFFSLSIYFVPHPSLCANVCNQRYWLAYWWTLSCLKSATHTHYTAITKRRTEMHTLSSCHLPLSQTDHYLAVDRSVTGRDPTLKGQEMKTWFRPIKVLRRQQDWGGGGVALSLSPGTVTSPMRQEVGF